VVCGNTCVIKPAQDTPLSTFNLVQALTDAGIPKGVINIVTGFGSEVGTPLTEHPTVRAISLTGSSAVGRIVGATAAKSFKHCSLELGGKNPMIVLDDANLDLAIEGGLWGAFGTTGQRCTATSRIIVQKGVYRKFVDEFVARAKKIKVGNGLDEGVEMGPAVNESQLKTDLKYIEIGKTKARRCDRRPSPRQGRLPARMVPRADGVSPMSIPRCASRRKKSLGRWSRSSRATTWRMPSRSPTTSSTVCRRRSTPRM
jgi:alpha-ketoglutaric semialdehyde dehydrogenase